MRRRKNIVSIRMNDNEYDTLKEQVQQAGVTQQSFIINAITGAVIAPAEEIAVQKDLSRTLADMDLQLRGLATNVNQLARIANTLGVLPSEEKLLKLHTEITNYRKECEDIWLSIRSSINRQRATER